MSKTVWESKYFCGNAISDYGMRNGFVDYRTLASAFDHVLNNEIMNQTETNGFYWEIENGTDYDDETDEYREYFQYYIISESGANILKDYTNETVWYCESLDMYVWGVTHFGTSWDYVLTDIPIDQKVVDEYNKERKYKQ